MADLEFVDQHNMVVYLEKMIGNLEFHEIVDFLTSSLIHHALTVSPTIYISYIGQFWNTASSQTVNDEKQIHATINSKAIVVTEASIRSSLLLNDADGTACLTNEAIFQNLALMGLKSTSWNEFSTNIASAIICLATNQKFNFSKLIFDGMLRNLDTPKKKFLMYPRFLMAFLNNQIELGKPFNDVYITPAHTQKVFSNISRKGVKFSGKVTPLFDSMLVPHQAPEGEGDQPLVTASSSSHDTTQDSSDSLEGTNESEGDQVHPSHDSHLSGGPTSERAKGGITLEELSVLCTNLSNRVLTLEASNDAQAAEIIKLKTRIKKLKKMSHPVISHHRAWLRSVSRLSMKRQLGRKEFVSKQGRKNAKPRPTLDAFDDLDADLAHGMEYMDIEEAVNEKGGSTFSTIRQRETPPTTTSIFDDEDVTMAQTLIKMKEEKAKEKGVAFKDVEDSSRPARYGKPHDYYRIFRANDYYKIVDWESKFYHIDRYGKPHDYYRIVRADGSSRYIKTFTEMVSRFDILDFIELHSLVMKRFKTSTPEGIDQILWGSLRTMFEANAEDDLWKNQEEWILKSWNFYDNCGVHILELEDGTKFYMLAERMYPLTKETLERMLALRLIAESKSKAVFDLLRFIQMKIDESGSHDGSKKDL
ncbi:hypothetical protein Tco_0961398 [Tanacetum coccineum]